MDNLLDSLSGVERVKYLKALIAKVNNIDAKVDRPHPKADAPSCPACASKAKRFLLECSRSDRIDLKRTKPTSQKCDVHRLKFAKHQASDSRAPSQFQVKMRHRQQIKINGLQAATDASFEAEKRYLREIYASKPAREMERQPKAAEKGHLEGATGPTLCSRRPAKADTDENAGLGCDQGSLHAGLVQSQPTDAEFPTSIVAERGASSTGDSRVATRSRTVAVANTQRILSEQQITLNSDGTRRIVSYSALLLDTRGALIPTK